jgi:hypothetical protein
MAAALTRAHPGWDQPGPEEALRPWRPCTPRRDRDAARRRWHQRSAATPSRGTHRAAGRVVTRPGGEPRRANAAARGCVRRRDRHDGRCRRRTSAGRRSRGRRSRSGHLAAPGDPRGAVPRRSHDRALARSGRELRPATLAAGPKDRLAGAGRHAMSEPVPLRPATVVGLVRALHLVPPLPRGLLASCRVQGAWG